MKKYLVLVVLVVVALSWGNARATEVVVPGTDGVCTPGGYKVEAAPNSNVKDFDADASKYSTTFKDAEAGFMGPNVEITVTGPFPALKSAYPKLYTRFQNTKAGMLAGTWVGAPGATITVDKKKVLNACPFSGGKFTCTLSLPKGIFDKLLVQFVVVAKTVSVDVDATKLDSYPHSPVFAVTTNTDCDNVPDFADDCIGTKAECEKKVDPCVADPKAEGCVKDDDADNDGIKDDADNCKNVENADQADGNSDGVGDACSGCDLDPTLEGCVTPEPPDDSDGDGFVNGGDNCPSVANPDQADSDGDGVGDVCDIVNDVNKKMIPNINLDGDASCSLMSGAAVNPLSFILIGMALLPVALRRKK